MADKYNLKEHMERFWREGPVARPSNVTMWKDTYVHYDLLENTYTFYQRAGLATKIKSFSGARRLGRPVRRPKHKI